MQYFSTINGILLVNVQLYMFPLNFAQVYFLWICPTHRNFEWFIDVLRFLFRFTKILAPLSPIMDFEATKGMEWMDDTP